MRRADMFGKKNNPDLSTPLMSDVSNPEESKVVSVPIDIGTLCRYKMLDVLNSRLDVHKEHASYRQKPEVTNRKVDDALCEKALIAIDGIERLAVAQKTGLERKDIALKCVLYIQQVNPELASKV